MSAASVKLTIVLVRSVGLACLLTGAYMVAGWGGVLIAVGYLLTRPS